MALWCSKLWKQNMGQETINAYYDEHLLEEDVLVNANNSKVEIGFQGGLTK
jgi:hypothetical protein